MPTGTSVLIIIDRNFPAATFGEASEGDLLSGVVHHMQMWDQLTASFPRSL